MTYRSALPLLMLMVVFSPLAIDIFLPALPLIADEFTVSLSQTQWSIGAFLLSMGAGQLLCGPMADKYGRRPIAITGALIYGLSSLLAAQSSNLESFLLLRVIQGFGACAIVVAAFASVRDRFNPMQSGIMYSYLSSVICCVPAIAPLLGNVLTEQFGWRSNFEAMAIYGVVAGGLIIWGFPETKPVRQSASVKFISMSQFLPIIKHPVFLFNALVNTLAMAIILAYVSSSPAWIMVHLEHSQHTFVWWFSANAIVSIVAYFFTPKVLLKLGPRKTIGLGMFTLLASGLMMLLLIGWLNVAAFMLPVMLSSIGISLVMGCCAGQALSPFGDNAGTASALLGFLQMSGAAVLVALLQLLPMSIPMQFGCLAMTLIPVLLLWQQPRMKQVLYETSYTNYIN